MMHSLPKWIPLILLAACSLSAETAGSQKASGPDAFYKSKPQVIFCTTTKDSFPIVRAMYFSKYQDGSYFYESVPKPLRSPGHSQHFLVSFDRFDSIRFHLPNEQSVFPDCAIGTSMSSLMTNGQTASFEFK